MTQKDFAFTSTSPLYMSTTFALYPCSSTCTRPKTVHGCTLMRYDQCAPVFGSFQESLLLTPAHAPSRLSAGGGGGRTAELRAIQRSAKACCLHRAELRIPRATGGRCAGVKSTTAPASLAAAKTGAGRDSVKLPTGESCITLTTSLPRRVRLGLRPRLLHFPRAPPLRPRQFGIGDSPARIMIGGSPARSWPWWRLSRP